MAKYTEKKRASNEKWDKENLRNGSYKMKIELYEAFEKYCIDNDISKNALISEAVAKYIDFLPVGTTGSDEK